MPFLSFPLVHAYMSQFFLLFCLCLSLTPLSFLAKRWGAVFLWPYWPPSPLEDCPLLSLLGTRAGIYLLPWPPECSPPNPEFIILAGCSKCTCTALVLAAAVHYINGPFVSRLTTSRCSSLSYTYLLCEW